jgi:hypothetical protein
VPLQCDRPTGACTGARPPCTSNESCASDERCESQTGLCVAGACLPDRFEPNGSPDTAAAIPRGQTPQLSLCGGRPDWFSLSLGSGDRVQVVADVDPLASFDLALYAPTGELLDENPKAVLAVAGSDGAYLLRAASGDAAVLYGLTAAVQPGQACARSPPAPHPTAASALPLPYGATLDLAVCPGEESWFRVSATVFPGVRVEAALDPTISGGVSLALFDAAGSATPLAEDTSGGQSPSVSAASSTTGAYSLRVRGLTEASRARYDLTVRSAWP